MVFNLFARQNRSGNLRQKARIVLRLFRELDKEIFRFCKKTGLQCREKCGHCCENPTIETTTVELFPLAIVLFKKKEAEVWLERCEQVDRKGRCVFYDADPERSGYGRCRVYPFRPLICRLFGFSTVNNKQGQPILVTCPVIKEDAPAALAKARSCLLAGEKASNMNDCVRRLFTVDPVLGVEQIPINEAIAQAIQKAGILLKQY